MARPRGARTDTPLGPITRTALRYTLSVREYIALHRCLTSVSTRLGKTIPHPDRYTAEVASREGDYNASAIRASARVFGFSMTAQILIDQLVDIARNYRRVRAGTARSVAVRRPVLAWKPSQLRLSASLSLVLLFHRLIYRFLIRLGHSLLLPASRPFRDRNGRLSRILTSRFTPSIGASLAGAFLAIYPSTKLRMTIAVHALIRALDVSFNALEMNGYFHRAPRWFGSWLLLPLSFGQLFYAFVFDRDCLPSIMVKGVLGAGGPYLDTRSSDTLLSLSPSPTSWPTSSDLVDGVRDLSTLNWPSFPGAESITPKLPLSMLSLSVITGSAHPSTRHLSCALLHPHDPSCVQTWTRCCTTEFPRISKVTALVIGSFALLTRFRSLISKPISTLGQTAATIVRTSITLTGGLASAWGSLCLFNSALPRHVLPRARVFIAGVVAGLWAVLLHSSRPRPGISSKTQSATAAADAISAQIPTSRKIYQSLLRYALASMAAMLARGTLLGSHPAKRQLPRGHRSSGRTDFKSAITLPLANAMRKLTENADVAVVIASLAVIQSVYLVCPPAVQGKRFRQACSWVLGDGFVDRCDVVDRIRQDRIGADDGDRAESTQVGDEPASQPNRVKRD